MGYIVTFYSYKGGVGRSMALANIAVLLAQSGYRVLAVDFDLEAPGLDKYFRSERLHRADNANPGGVIGYLTSAESTGSVRDWSEYITRIFESSRNYHFDFLPSGVESKSYRELVTNFSWDRFFDQHQGSQRVEEIRNEWKENYDVVLVDSRTGITDVGGICTIQLPDVLIPVFSTNTQSFEGAKEVTELAIKLRQRLPFDRQKLLIMPLLSRFDGREESKLGQQWLDRTEREFGEYFDDWITSESNAKSVIVSTKIPYVPIFGFGENLPVLTHDLNDADFPGFNYRNVVNLLSQVLFGTAAPRLQSSISTDLKHLHSQFAKNWPPSRSPIQGYVDRDLILIIFSRKDMTSQLNFKAIFEDNLTAANLSLQGKLQIMFFVDEQIVPGSNWEAEIRAAIDRTRVAVILEGPGLFTSEFVQQEEIPRFLENAQKASGLQVFRIPIRPAASRLVPSGLKRLQSAHPIEQPLSDMSKAKRHSAIGRIVDKLLEAYEDDITYSPKDEFINPPFTIWESVGKVELFPDSLIHATRIFVTGEKTFDSSLHRNLAALLDSGETLVVPLELDSTDWIESTKSVSLLNMLPDLLFEMRAMVYVRYQRFRDAEMRLCQIQNEDGTGHQSRRRLSDTRQLLLELHKDMEIFADYTEKLYDHRRELFDLDFVKYSDMLNACSAVPYATLGVLIRLDQALIQPMPHSVEHCYVLLGRVSHWLFTLYQWTSAAVKSAKPNKINESA